MGLVVDPAAVTVEEADDPATQNISEHQGTYTVRLATEPSADVTVAVTGQAGSDLTLDTESLTFTVAKWNEAQTVTVTAAEDDDASNDEVTLKHTASGGDYGSVVLDVGVTVEDDDTVGLVVAGGGDGGRGRGCDVHGEVGHGAERGRDGGGHGASGHGRERGHGVADVHGDPRSGTRRRR